MCTEYVSYGNIKTKKIEIGLRPLRLLNSKKPWYPPVY